MLDANGAPEHVTARGVRRFNLGALTSADAAYIFLAQSRVGVAPLANPDTPTAASESSAGIDESLSDPLDTSFKMPDSPSTTA